VAAGVAVDADSAARIAVLVGIGMMLVALVVEGEPVRGSSLEIREPARGVE